MTPPVAAGLTREGDSADHTFLDAHTDADRDSIAVHDPVAGYMRALVRDLAAGAFLPVIGGVGGPLHIVEILVVVVYMVRFHNILLRAADGAGEGACAVLVLGGLYGNNTVVPLVCFLLLIAADAGTMVVFIVELGPFAVGVLGQFRYIFGLGGVTNGTGVGLDSNVFVGSWSGNLTFVPGMASLRSASPQSQD